MLAKVEASKKSRIASPGVALELGDSPQLTLEDATVDGAQTGVRAGFNARIRLDDGAVVSRQNVGLEASSNLHPEVDFGRVEGGAVAVQSQSNAEIQVRGGVLSAPREQALVLGANSHVQLAHAAITGARKVGSNSPVDER